MEEKVIAEGIPGNTKKRFGSILMLVSTCVFILSLGLTYDAAALNAWIDPPLFPINIPAIVAVICIPCAFIGRVCSKSAQHITVTNRRVFCTTTLWLWSMHRVDLPLDSITAIERKYKAVSISTPSIHLTFGDIKNQNEIYDALTALLLERQTAGKAPAGELKQYKELLDSGVITQQEFDEKKRQLLGL